jgi:hypothetical protein
MEWIHLAQDRVQWWQVIVNVVMNCRISYKVENFFIQMLVSQ